jgi:hypothetical protein
VVRWVAVAVASAALFAAPVSGALADAVAIPKLYKNCTNLNKRYPHGIGKNNAHDRTSGTKPVRNFKRSTKLYKRAMSYNRGLDRDKDGVACEKL